MNMFNNTNKLFLALKLSEYILEALRKIVYFLFFQMLMLAIQPKDKKYTLLYVINNCDICIFMLFLNFVHCVEESQPVIISTEILCNYTITDMKNKYRKG